MKRLPILIAFLFVLSLLVLPVTAQRTVGSFERVDPRFDELVPADAKLEVLAEGFEWTEGPVWSKFEGYLLFSDIPRNTIYRWDEENGLRVYIRPAGYSGAEPPGFELGTNGLLFDAEGRLVACDHGNRQIVRFDTTNFTRTTLADRYEGKRLNSPNDAVFRSNGDLYFTDPPYGLRGLNDSPLKELPYNGVYRLSADGELTLLTDELSFPNGIAFSPDESHVYVNADYNRIMRYAVNADGTLSNGEVFIEGEGSDGIKVDERGNVYTTSGAGPGEVRITSPEGVRLGTLKLPVFNREPAVQICATNIAFGDDDSKGLYITACEHNYRVQMNVAGIRPQPK